MKYIISEEKRLQWFRELKETYKWHKYKEGKDIPDEAMELLIKIPGQKQTSGYGWSSKGKFYLTCISIPGDPMHFLTGKEDYEIQITHYAWEFNDNYIAKHGLSKK